MSNFLRLIKKTPVKTVIITVLSLHSPFLHAADSTSTNVVPECYPYKDSPTEYSSCVKGLREENSSDKNKSECATLRQTIKDAINDRAKACKSAGAGNDCADRVEACTEAASDSDSGGLTVNNTTGALLTAFGADSSIVSAVNQAGNTSSSNNSCPQFTAQDYWQKKDKYEKDLKDAEKDLADLKDDQAKAQEDFNKEISDLQEDLNKAQEDLDATKLEIKEEKRKKLQEIQSTQASAKEEIDNKETEILQLRGKLITSQRDKALQLIAINEAAAKRACLNAVKEQKKSYEALSSGTGTSTQISESRRRRADLIAVYNDCMDGVDQKRAALNESKKQEQEEIEDAIKKAENRIAAINDSLNTAQSQLTEMMNDEDTKQSQAEQKLIKMMQNTQNKMTAAKQKLETTLEGITSKTKSYTEEINRIKTALSTLGPVPKAGATEVISNISEDLQGYETTRKEAENEAKRLGCGFGSSSSSGRGVVK